MSVKGPVASINDCPSLKKKTNKTYAYFFIFQGHDFFTVLTGHKPSLVSCELQHKKLSPISTWVLTFIGRTRQRTNPT